MTGTAAAMKTLYVPVPYIPVVGRNWNWRWYARALRHHEEEFNRADVVFVPWLYPDGVAAAVLAGVHERPVWLMALGSDRFHLDVRERRRVILRACNQAAGIVCNARHVGDYLVARGVAREKIHIVRNGIGAGFRWRRVGAQGGVGATEDGDVGTCGSSHPERSEGSADKTDRIVNKSAPAPRILFVGNLVRIKAPDLAVRAVGALGGGGTTECRGDGVVRPKIETCVAEPGRGTQSTIDNQQSDIRPAPSLLILGTGPMRKKLIRLAAKLGVADRVRFLGSRPHAEVAEWMNAADCLLLTSRSEGSPNVVAEALACGLPVVATAVGDVPERIENGRNGRVVELAPENTLVERLAAAVDTTLNTRWDRQAIAAANPACSWRDAAEELLQLFQR